MEITDKTEYKYKTGDKVILHGRLFSNSQTHTGMIRSGEWYIYDGRPVFGRYRITTQMERVGKYPISVNVSGYVNPEDIELSDLK